MPITTLRTIYSPVLDANRLRYRLYMPILRADVRRPRVATFVNSSRHRIENAALGCGDPSSAGILGCWMFGILIVASCTTRGRVLRVRSLPIPRQASRWAKTPEDRLNIVPGRAGGLLRPYMRGWHTSVRMAPNGFHAGYPYGGAVPKEPSDQKTNVFLCALVG